MLLAAAVDSATTAPEAPTVLRPGARTGGGPSAGKGDGGFRHGRCTLDEPPISSSAVRRPLVPGAGTWPLVDRRRRSRRVPGGVEGSGPYADRSPTRVKR